MALIDVVKFEGDNTEFVWKFPSNDLKLGTQLIVNTSQCAFFVKNGKVLDSFNEGRHTLKSSNIPLLNRLVNLPFGGNSPFSAEVWYVNLISKLDNKWGTIKPINIEDPLHGVIVPVRAFGQFGLRIIDPKNFLTTIVGTAKVFTANEIAEYFKGKILSSITTIISKKIVLDKISLLQIGVFQDDLGKFCQTELSQEFLNYGIEVSNFNFMSINIPSDDPSFVRLKEAKELAMKVKTLGKDIYQMDRSFDVMEKAATNEGNSGNIINAGIGLGAGLGLGNILGNQFGQAAGNLNANPAKAQLVPPLIRYYFVINGVQSQGYLINDLSLLVSEGLLKKDTLAWREGLSDWVQATTINEIKILFESTPPPIPNK